MKKLSSCILIEWRKLIKSKLSIVTACSICLVPFIVGLFATMMKYPENFKNLGLILQKWNDEDNRLVVILNDHITSHFCWGIAHFGFTASWVFGREYSDKTMIDLLALPIRRDTIVLSKFIVIALWSYILSIFALLLGLLAGNLIGLEGGSLTVIFKGVLTFGFCTTLTIILSTPVALFACLGRGYLSPLAFIIFTIIFSQLGSALNFGKYIPWAIPALASGIAGKALLNFGSIVSLFGVSILGLIATIAWWRYADYD